LGETYLTTHRAIPKPPGGWPDAVRYRPGDRCLILAGTTESDEVMFVQRVFLEADGRKAPGPKLTNGVKNSAYIRLPATPTRANGPLLLGEGPETCLSSWVSTGHETWGAAGPNTGHDPPLKRVCVLLADDDPADLALAKKLAEWLRAGTDIRVATPWQVRRHDKSDFNDLLQIEGIDAVRARIEAALAVRVDTRPHFSRPFLSGDAASRRLKRVVSASFDRIELCLQCRDGINNKANCMQPAIQAAIEQRYFDKAVREGKNDPEAREAAAIKAAKYAPGIAKRRARKAAIGIFAARVASGVMPRIQIKAAAGSGKTRAIISRRTALRRPRLRTKTRQANCAAASPRWSNAKRRTTSRFLSSRR
jgi:hypothetical protein